MLTNETEKTLARFLAIGSFVVTTLVITGSVTDPVNVTKFVPLGAVAVAAILILSLDKFRVLMTSRKTTLLVALSFLLASINALVASSAPISQSLYGAYGRNNGFLTYIFLLLTLIGAASLSKLESFKKLNFALYASAVVNLVYCLWVLTFGDFLGWNNPYGNILGTFGNPNFSGAFIALSSVSLFTLVLDGTNRKGIRLSVLIAIAIGIYEVYMSSALQGQILLVAGFGYLGFLLLYYKSKVISFLYLLVGMSVATIGILGTQQVGPLAGYLYKTSVTLRGQYWLAGWNMGSSHPLTGVGFDSYGDWYRRSREAKALVSPGVDVTTNTAHNVPLDIFAFGGWPLFLSYLTILSLTIASIIRVIRRRRNFDPVFASLSAAWLCYQLQSIISINQLGLAIWGWLLSGALIAFDHMDKQNSSQDEAFENHSRRKTRETGVISAGLLGTAGILIGAFIAWPALNADMKWSSAQTSRDLVKFEESLRANFMNPQNSYKYGKSIEILEKSGLSEKARQYALEAAEFNPDSFEAWKVLYLISGSTDVEKAKALQNMKRLDPRNPDIISR
jgi:O-antigen ligase